MRVLVAHASKRGGTAGIADQITCRLRDRGLEVECSAADEVDNPDTFDAFVVGSALYSGRWQRSAVRLLRRLKSTAAPGRVFVFHSGPLGDDEAAEPQLPPRRVASLVARLDGAPVETFGGRLDADTTGFVAKGKVKSGHAGDWRDPEAITAWADQVADELVGESYPA